VRTPFVAIAASALLLVAETGCGPPDYLRVTASLDAGTDPATMATVDPSLLGYWRFDDRTGATVTDSSGLGHHGTIIANQGTPRPVWTTGKVGGALAFDGNTFVSVPDSPDWDRVGGANAFSVVAWVIRQNDAAGWNTVVSRQYQTTQWEHFNLGFKDDSLTPIAGTQVNPLWYCTAPSPTTDGLWMHIAGTYDGTTLRGYENGAEICHLDFSTVLTTDDTGIIIGGKINDRGPLVQQVFTGLIDELAVFSRALDASEIVAIARGQPVAH
jgi:hypothetical protein